MMTRRNEGLIRGLTTAGLIVAALALGASVGRADDKTGERSVRLRGLHERLARAEAIGRAVDTRLVELKGFGATGGKAESLHERLSLDVEVDEAFERMIRERSVRLSPSDESSPIVIGQMIVDEIDSTRELTPNDLIDVTVTTVRPSAPTMARLATRGVICDAVLTGVL